MKERIKERGIHAVSNGMNALMRGNYDLCVKFNEFLRKSCIKMCK